MYVLNLVTNPEARFYEQQVNVLERQGIQETTVPVPGVRKTTDGETVSRSTVDYARHYPQVLRHAFNGYDIIHANYGLTAPAALAQPTRPVVLSLWGSDLFGRYSWVSKLSARMVDAVIVMSEEMAETLSISHCHVIPHGIDLERFQPMDQTVARNRVGWDHDAYHVLFPYSESRHVKDYPRAKSIVKAVQSKISSDVTLQTLHGAPHCHMPYYLNAADVLLLTSKHEGSPNSVKEAMACNLPVVATDVGDVGTLLAGVSTSSVGQLDSELTDQVFEILIRGERSDGRNHIKPYDLTTMGRRICAVYESVLDTS